MCGGVAWLLGPMTVAASPRLLGPMTVAAAPRLLARRGGGRVSSNGTSVGSHERGSHERWHPYRPCPM